jgi:hypothetical protein
MRPAFHGLLIRVVVAATAAVRASSSEPSDPPVPAKTPSLESAGVIPAEEIRLSPSVFHEGLKRRGLTDILEQHIREFPPSGTVAAKLMLRDLKLTEFGDAHRSPAERRVVLKGANEILEDLIREETADPRRFDWRFELAHSLLYQEGEPFATNILYLGGSRRDREQLQPLAARAVAALEALASELAAEYEHIDKMSIAEFEKLERAGYIEQLDRLGPRAEYLRLWAAFHEALAMERSDHRMAERLNGIMEYLKAHPTLLETPHSVSRVQVQSLVLSGMTRRRLNDHAAARSALDAAIGVAGRLDDASERERVDWAVRLAWVEGIRNHIEDGRFDEAQAALARFRELDVGQSERTRGLAICAALLERSLMRGRAQTAARMGRDGEARRWLDQAWQPLTQLARRSSTDRQELYAVLYDLLGAEPDPDSLDPFERAAVIASLISDAGRAGENGAALYRRAVEWGRQFAAQISDAAAALAPELLPEILFNVGVAQYRLGRIGDAIDTFLEVGERHPGFARAQSAAVHAVHLAAQLYAEAGPDGQRDAQDRYRRALQTVVTEYAQSDEAKQLRFHYARLLEEMEDFDRAAVQYASVREDHESHLESQFNRVRCQFAALQRHAQETPADGLGLQRRLNDFLTAQRNFIVLAESARNRETNADRAALIRRLIASARLLLAEVQISPAVDRPVQVLETLTSWESDCPECADLLGRALRVRLLALEKLGRLDEATRALPQYVASDPQGAGPTLQALYVTTAGAIEPLREKGKTEEAQRKAEAALLIAEQLHEWAVQAGSALEPDALQRIRLQLAEANLQAARYEKARSLFEQFFPALARSAVPPEWESLDPSILFGYAESLYGTGRFDAALPFFQRLATRLDPSDSLRWKALLRDLQCRTALNHPPDRIIKVIRQQRYLDLHMGGPALAAQFDALLKQNEERPGSP